MLSYAALDIGVVIPPSVRPSVILHCCVKAAKHISEILSRHTIPRSKKQSKKLFPITDLDRGYPKRRVKFMLRKYRGFRPISRCISETVIDVGNSCY